MSNRYSLDQVVGGCMEPVLYQGDRVLVDRQKRDVSVGDVVVLRGLTHRVCCVDPWGGIWHAGDRSRRLGRSALHDIKGVVVGAVRDGEWTELARASAHPLQSRLRFCWEIGRYAIYGMRTQSVSSWPLLRRFRR